MYVCMYVYMYVCMYVYIYIYIYTYIHTFVIVSIDMLQLFQSPREAAQPTKGLGEGGRHPRRSELGSYSLVISG